MPDLIDLLKKAYSEGNRYNHERIYDVSEGVVAKSFITQHEAIYEFEFGRELHSKGIRGPKMIQVEGLEFTIALKNYYDLWFLLMQKIKGMTIGNIAEADRSDAYRQYREQIGKVLDMGINPIDSDWHGNSMYDSDEKKLYLIDFGQWSRIGTATDLESERERVSGPLAFRYNRMSI